MSDYDDDRPSRENLMQRRLRKARGEAIDDDLDPYELYDDDDEPRAFGGGYGLARADGDPFGGCAQATLYALLGTIVIVLLAGLFFNQAISRVGSILQPPPIAAIIATPTPAMVTGAAVVQRIQQLSRLVTASYTIQTVVDARQGSNIPVVGDFLAGDELLLIAHGTVEAGVDLGKLTADAVTVAPDGSVVTVRLPAAEIFTATLDSRKTRVYSRERGIFAPENKDLESEARRRAEELILQSACEDGILGKATDQAEVALRQFVGLVESVQVVVIPAPPGPCAP